jgi:hypothetical protein
MRPPAMAVALAAGDQPRPGGAGIAQPPMARSSVPPIQRKCAECAEGGNQLLDHDSARVVQRAPMGSTHAIRRQELSDPAMSLADASTDAGLLVDDDGSVALPGQMRKSEFLAAVEAQVCTAIEPILASVDRTTDGCPYLARLFLYLGRRSAESLTAMLHRFAPELAGASSARDYIPAIVARARTAASGWATSGVIEGLPAGLSITSFADLFSTSDRSQAPPAESGPVPDDLSFKARGGGERHDHDPRVIRRRLGPGRSLDGGVQARMESAFGRSFAHVRLHTDARAAELSGSLNARAFTTGVHVAFGGGEYRPGTLGGDALIAHELAHVVQQTGAGESVIAAGEPSSTDASRTPSSADLEADADRSAVLAVAHSRGWSGLLSGVWSGAMRTIRTRLGLQRCGRERCPPGQSFFPKAGMGIGNLGPGICRWQCWPTPPERRLGDGPSIGRAPPPSVFDREPVGVNTPAFYNANTGTCLCDPPRDPDTGEPLRGGEAIDCGSVGVPTRGRAGIRGGTPSQRGRRPGRGGSGSPRVRPRQRDPRRAPRAHRPAREVARDGRWPSTTPDHPNSGLQPHFEKHGRQVGAESVQQYDQSARQTIVNGRRFTYRDRSSNEARVGYWDPNTGYFTATTQSGQSPRGVSILTHFPLTWDEARRLPGFSTAD